MTRQLVLGMDGGASKTECSLETVEATEVALVRGGPSNHEMVGFDGAARCISDLVSQALDKAGARIGDIRAACFALAGMDIPPDRPILRERIVDPLGLNCPIEIVNDAFAGFRAGSQEGTGVCVSLGSGTTFCGRNARGESIQFEFPKPDGIDSRILRALIAEYHGIGPACGFRDAYLEALGLSSLEELYWSLYAGSRPYAKKCDPTQVSKARQLIFSEAFRDDEVLCEIFRRYAEELAEVLVGMARRLQIGKDEPFDVVLSGSLLTEGRHPVLNGGTIENVKRTYPQAHGVVVSRAPVSGAVRMARELLLKEHGRAQY